MLCLSVFFNSILVVYWFFLLGTGVMIRFQVLVILIVFVNCLLFHYFRGAVSFVGFLYSILFGVRGSIWMLVYLWINVGLLRCYRWV